MGSALSVVPPLASAIVSIISVIRSSNVKENPAFGRMFDMNINSNRLEEEKRKLDEATRAAEAASRHAEQARAAARQAEEVAKRISETAQEAVETTRERIRADTDEAREQARRAEAALDAVLKAATEAQEKNSQAQEAMEVALRRLGTAEERARNAERCMKDLEDRLRKGIRPVVTPTYDEIRDAKQRVGYEDGLFHFAIAGCGGVGKSSLINAFRGLRNRETALSAAHTGVNETTLELARFLDPDPANPFVWYDIPGAGTLRVPDWQYFNDQLLYVFDCLVVVIGDRFTMSDIAILTNCKRFDIPSYIVRSKSDLHIRSIMDEMEDEDGDDTLYYAAYEQYITQTQVSMQRYLRDAGLPEQKVYLVSYKALLAVVRDHTLPEVPNMMIDELELLHDLFSEARSRRSIPEK